MKQKQSKAERLSYFKMRYPDDAILEYVVWKLPHPTAENVFVSLEQLTRDFLADVQAHRAKEVSDD
jgi:hypothetical protein